MVTNVKMRQERVYENVCVRGGGRIEVPGKYLYNGIKKERMKVPGLVFKYTGLVYAVLCQ